ncbi:MAG: alpha/beta hydrolase [Prevotella sp.]|nr:alpha/beta hydrolase [Prevotella sp.]
MNLKRLFICLSMGVMTLAASAQSSFELPLWPQGAPNDNGDKQDTAKVFVYLPDAKTATGRAIVVCPGGGYCMLAMDHEGKQWAPFFNNMGIATIVLKYRMPHGNKEVPFTDAEAAIKLVRANARKWHIDPNNVGIMGSSAGGHLASTVATRASGQAKPNFQILFYPVITMMPGYTHQGSHDFLLGKDAKKKDEKEYSNDMRVTRATPRAWIVLSDDDDVVIPANGVNYYNELYRHDVPASLHVYPTGGHGWGIGTWFKFHTPMLTELEAWLRSF